MIIVCDSREQRGLDFSWSPAVTKTITEGMPYGDYWARLEGDFNGWEPPLVFERKSISDLWGTMTFGYERFKREMQRAKAVDCKLVLAIEGTYSEVLAGFHRSEFSGDAMIQKLNTLYVKYDLESWFCENRAIMARRIVDAYSAIGRVYKKEKQGEHAKV